MAISRTSLLVGVAGLLIGGGAMALASRQGPAFGNDRAHVEQIVRSYILEHPEILREASDVLHARDTAEVVRANRHLIEAPYAGAWAGAKDADVTLVEFFDYACPYCHRTNGDVDRLLKEDPKLKVVWRELPVLGPDSEAAAEVSMAAARQGNYKQFHDTLFAQGRPTPQALAAVQKQLGVRALPGGAEARAELDKNLQLARALNASGTPTFVVGDKVLQGAVGYDALKQAVAEARSRS